MAGSTSKRRRKRARKKRNRASKLEPVPIESSARERSRYSFTARGGAKLEIDFSDSRKMKWDGATAISRDDVIKKLWEDTDYAVTGDEH